MSFHPKNPATESEQQFLVSPTENKEIHESYPGTVKYSMMLVQKFSQLQQASDKLQNKVTIVSCGLTSTIKTLWYLGLINIKRSMEVYHDGQKENSNEKRRCQSRSEVAEVWVKKKWQRRWY